VLGPGAGAPGLVLEDVPGVPGGRRVREEEMRRSEFWGMPWVEEAVAVQEGIRKGMMARGS
jgi:hypothetical protein